MAVSTLLITKDNHSEYEDIYQEFIKELSDAMYGWYPKEFHARWETDENSEHTLLNLVEGDYSLYIILENDVVVGYINTHYINIVHCLYIDHFFIKSDYRKKGIAGIVLDRLFKDAKKQGIEVIELGVFTRNTIARKLYDKLGFRTHTSFMYKKL